MSEYPTAWQKKTMWTALSTVSVVTIGATAVGLVWLLSQILGFLQPILIPFAVAGVMAFLLNPVVAKLVKWGQSRQRAVLCVFAVVSLVFVGVLLWVLPTLRYQSVQLAGKLPKLTQDAGKMIADYAKDIRHKYNIQILPDLLPDSASGEETTDVTGLTDKPGTGSHSDSEGGSDGQTGTTGTTAKANGTSSKATADDSLTLQQLTSGKWVGTVLPTVVQNTWKLVRNSVGGFLGVFGFVLSFVIVPIYLYYFLIESPNIAQFWGDYLPLRSSRFKDELVSTVEEINGYLIAFFRGQLLVSIINGTATGIGLAVIGLDFGLLIGLLLCFLGLIPYLGIILCWVPAVLIAAVHGGSWLIPASPWWWFPLAVTIIFVLVQQIDGLFVTPRIVGGSVGLHPLTVIVSVFVWSLLMGGLLGAILAVPMTATLKVLLKRYVWERRFAASEVAAPELADAAAAGASTVPSAPDKGTPEKGTRD